MASYGFYAYFFMDASVISLSFEKAYVSTSSASSTFFLVFFVTVNYDCDFHDISLTRIFN